MFRDLPKVISLLERLVLAVERIAEKLESYDEIDVVDIKELRQHR